MPRDLEAQELAMSPPSAAKASYFRLPKCLLRKTPSYLDKFEEAKNFGISNNKRKIDLTDIENGLSNANGYCKCDYGGPLTPDGVSPSKNNSKGMSLPEIQALLLKAASTFTYDDESSDESSGAAGASDVGEHGKCARPLSVCRESGPICMEPEPSVIAGIMSTISQFKLGTSLSAWFRSSPAWIPAFSLAQASEVKGRADCDEKAIPVQDTSAVSPIHAQRNGTYIIDGKVCKLEPSSTDIVHADHTYAIAIILILWLLVQTIVIRFVL